MCEGDACPIPAVSEWGLAAMTLLILAAGMVMFRRSRAVACN
ncbi:MAG: IPTL-CTERM sorting domain-containing protein [Phycisphaerales bacterium]|nr:MAG: IPTL-CTERM sorting domain-containing protein [Phycisphaerales bacterium]